MQKSGLNDQSQLKRIIYLTSSLWFESLLQPFQVSKLVLSLLTMIFARLSWLIWVTVWVICKSKSSSLIDKSEEKFRELWAWLDLVDEACVRSRLQKEPWVIPTSFLRLFSSKNEKSLKHYLLHFRLLYSPFSCERESRMRFNKEKTFGWASLPSFFFISLFFLFDLCLWTLTRPFFRFTLTFH